MKRLAPVPLLLAALAGCTKPEGHARKIEAGSDLFTATASMRVEITTNDIPNVLPFTGSIAMVADPFGSRGPYQLGDANVAITRLESIAEPGDDEVLVRALLGEMQFVSAQPLTLTVNGTPEDFVVRARATPEGDHELGTVALTRKFYMLDLPLLLSVELTSTQRTVTNVPEPDIWSAGLGFRVPLSECPTKELEARGLEFDLCARDVDGFSTSLAPFRFESILLQPAADNGMVVGSAITIAPSASIHPSVLIGPSSSIGDGVEIGAGAILGESVFVAAGSKIGEDVILVDGVIVGSNVTIGDDSVVDYKTVIEDGAIVGADVRIGPFSSIGNSASIGDGATLGSDVTFGAFAGILPGLIVESGGFVDPTTPLLESLVTCELTSGEVLVTTGFSCVTEYLGEPGCMLPRPVSIDQQITLTQTTPATPQNMPPDVLENLTMAINSAGVGGPAGRAAKPYHLPDNDCDDFASRLEKKLQAAGFDATFTVIKQYRYRSDEDAFIWWLFDLPNPYVYSGHAITDIHLADGRTVWIEPQADMTEAPNALNHGTVNLDGNGDGTVTTANGPGNTPTDGMTRIEVYPSREAAEAAGVKLD